MKRTRAVLSVAVVLLTLVSRAHAFDDGDMQVWTAASVTGDLADNWKLSTMSQTRFGDDADDRFLHNADVGLTYSSRKLLSVGINYRQQYTRSATEWVEEKRPHLNATFRWKARSMSIKDRNLFEFRFREGKDDIVRYRNKLSLEFPVKREELKAVPYVANEIFIDSDHGDFNQNRVTVGLKAAMAKVNPDIHLIWQTSDAGDAWIDTYVIGMKLTVKL